MSEHTRRTFLQMTGVGLGAAAGFRAGAGPNERVRHAVIGSGGMGSDHARAFDSFADCDVVAVCDVDPEGRARALSELSDPSSVREVEDFRELMQDDSIDTVSIATPDHWHTPIALHALQAGKHVYVEKPCTHNLAEGAVLKRAAELTGKCVQHGTQKRVYSGYRKAVQYLREGRLGKIRMAKVFNHQFRDSIGRAPVEDPPPGVNYDLWLGPAAKRPFTRNRWHYEWHWMWDYGTGDLGNDGIHPLDVARWGLGKGYPKAVSGSGGQLFYNDDHETPDTQVVTYEYDDCYLVYEMRLWTDYPLAGGSIVFYGDKGILEIGRNCYATIGNQERQQISTGERNHILLEPHVRNFLDAVKANDPSRLAAPIEEGIISAALCHMGNIATRVGKRLEFDAETGRFDDGEANALLSRSYRKGYELPEIG